jgi:hypothetical protein
MPRQDPKNIKESPAKRDYEPPQLVALGNLRDLLAGGGSHACDGSIPQLGTNDTLC